MKLLVTSMILVTAVLGLPSIHARDVGQALSGRNSGGGGGSCDCHGGGGDGGWGHGGGHGGGGGDGGWGHGGGGGGHGGGGGGGGLLRCPSGLYSIPQCCSADVLGLADLDCKTPRGQFSAATCAADGGRAKCCVLPVAGQSVLCTDPISA